MPLSLWESLRSFFFLFLAFSAIWANRASTCICTHALSSIPSVIVGLTSSISASSIEILYLHIVNYLYVSWAKVRKSEDKTKEFYSFFCRAWVLSLRFTQQGYIKLSNFQKKYGNIWNLFDYFLSLPSEHLFNTGFPALRARRGGHVWG